MKSEEKTIAVTHINIRQSISFLLTKLVLIDILAVVGVLIFFSLLVSSNLATEAKLLILPSYGFYFIGIIILKICLSLFSILQWLFEYYEIWPDRVIHKKGVIWTTREDHEFKDVKYLGFQQGLFGRLLNFGTITLYDWKNEATVTLYLIHNPKKYFLVLKNIVPTMEMEKRSILDHVKDEDG